MHLAHMGWVQHARCVTVLQHFLEAQKTLAQMWHVVIGRVSMSAESEEGRENSMTVVCPGRPPPRTRLENRVVLDDDMNE